MIDEYLEILWTAMQRLWPGLQRRPRQPRTLVSCDVDSPFAFNAWPPSFKPPVGRPGQATDHPHPAVPSRGKTLAQASYHLARSLAGDLVKRRAPGLAWRNLRGQWRARRGDHRLDPHRAGLAHIMDVNERAGRAVAFYFIPENTDPRLDNRVSLDDPRLRALLREIHARGHEIGSHPG